MVISAFYGYQKLSFRLSSLTYTWSGTYRYTQHMNPGYIWWTGSRMKYDWFQFKIRIQRKVTSKWRSEFSVKVSRRKMDTWQSMPTESNSYSAIRPRHFGSVRNALLRGCIRTVQLPDDFRCGTDRIPCQFVSMFRKGWRDSQEICTPQRESEKDSGQFGFCKDRSSSCQAASAFSRTGSAGSSRTAV